MRINLKAFLNYCKVNFFNSYYYGQLIEKHGIYFGSGNNVHFVGHRVKRPFGHVIFSAIVTALFSVRCLAVIVDHRWQMYTAHQLLPSNGTANVEITLLIWSVLQMLYTFYGLSEFTLEYKMLAPLMVRVNGPIRGKDLGLNEDLLNSFLSFRGRALLSSTTITATITICGELAIILRFIQLCFQGQDSTQLIVCLFWIVYVPFWLVYVCFAAYAQPVVIMSIAYYLHIKQKFARNELQSLNSLFGRLSIKTTANLFNVKQMIHRRFRAINRQYADIMKESADYGTMVGRILSIIFLMFVIAISYCTYLLFLTQMTPFFVFIYWVVYMAHIGLLTATIYRSSYLARSNRQMASHVITYYQRHTVQAKLFDHREMLKIDSISQSLNSSNSGFKLVNNFVIDSNAYYSVLYNISTFFFLIFRK